MCPSSYDLGERIRVALLSVTEGEDKPLKYPRPVQLGRRGGDHQDRSRRALRLRPRAGPQNINEIRPGIRIFETSAKTGAGMDEWLAYLAEQARPS